MFLDDLQELARKEMLELIERLLLEADLDSELSKLDVYGKNIDGIKDFLKHLLLDPNTGKMTRYKIDLVDIMTNIIKVIKETRSCNL